MLPKEIKVEMAERRIEKMLETINQIFDPIIALLTITIINKIFSVSNLT